MIRNLMIALLSVGFLSGCASMALPGDKNCTTDFLQCIEEPREVELPTFTKLRMLPPAETRPIVAVYTFSDLTGQRLSSDGAASFSTAVTQGARDLLIDALKAAGADSDPKGTWFRVVERGLGLDHLVRERQIIRSTSDSYATAESPTQDVQPLLFSVLTGEVILNVQTYKTILSVGMGGDVFKFLHMDTQLLELESGMTENESVTWGVRSAIEASVYALIEQGDERGFWKINYPPADQEVETIETTPIDAEAYKNTLSTVNGTDTDSSGTKKIKTFDSKIASGENEND